MNSETYRLIKLNIQVISVIFSILVNSILIYLIIKKSPINMGTYRHLMVYFCCCSIIFGVLDVIVQPNIQTYKSAFFMVVDVKQRNMTVGLGKFCVYGLCGCFGVAIYGIAIHFVYRFFALERRGRIRYFQGFYLAFWFVIPILGGVAWFLVTAMVFPKTKLETEYIRIAVRETFDIDIDDCVYNAGVFFPLDETGKRVIGWGSFAGFACYLSIMTIPFTIILIFGFKSWKIVRELLDHGESEYSKNLQMQLYKALVAQTLVPVVLLFIPFGLLFSLPIFEIDCQFLAAIITLIFAIYPAVDPLPILYFVDYYRIPLIELLCGCIGVTVYSIAIHFIYRLLALERQGRLKYFNDQYLLVWFGIPILAGAGWFAVTRFVYGMSSLSTNYIRNTVEEFFNLKMEDCVYGAAVFYPIDENGQQFVSWEAFFGLTCYMTILTIPFVTILVCGVKSFKKVRGLLDHGESEFARNLQMQLYKALIAQTIIPIFGFFIPFGFIFILPVFEIDCQFLGAPITLVFAMYPVIDPLPTLFFVDYYRIAIFEVFNACRCKKARIEGVPDESVSRGYPNTV